MKLRTKQILIMLIVLAGAMGVCAAFSIGRLKDYSLSVQVESEREKLRIAGRAFRQVGTREDFEQMGEIARDAYLKYQFERCYQSGYGLIKNGECILNLTDYEVVNLAGLKGEYRVQKLGRKHILLLRQALEYPEGFEVLAARDISQAWQELERQALGYLAVFGGVSLAAATVFALCLGRTLRSLNALRQAASAISGGELGAKVEILGRDEIAQVGEAFNHMSEQVEQQVENLELLLGALAHEMKTPVTAVMGYSDSLLNVRLTKEQQERALQNIHSAGARMEQMSAKLLALVGLYDNEAIVREPVPVEELFDRVRRETGELLEKKGMKLRISCEQGMRILGDETLLCSLFVNLVHNSIKASGPGSEIRMCGQGRTIRVEDQGCGIPEEDLPRVTEAFYMADKSRSRSEGGSGLGLALGLRIVKLHGGNMEILSRVGEGTCVAVTFPETVVFPEEVASPEGVKDAEDGA